jgi:hypothetical protein
VLKRLDPFSAAEFKSDGIKWINSGLSNDMKINREVIAK